MLKIIFKKYNRVAKVVRVVSDFRDPNDPKKLKLP